MSSNNTCVSCKKTVRPRQEAVMCDQCARWQHRICHTGISREMYRHMVKGLINPSFFCTNCRNSVEAGVSQQPVTKVSLIEDCEEEIEVTLKVVNAKIQRGTNKRVSDGDLVGAVKRRRTSNDLSDTSNMTESISALMSDSDLMAKLNSISTEEENDAFTNLADGMLEEYIDTRETRAYSHRSQLGVANQHPYAELYDDSPLTIDLEKDIDGDSCALFRMTETRHDRRKVNTDYLGVCFVPFRSEKITM